MKGPITRRKFFEYSLQASGGIALASLTASYAAADDKPLPFKISLAEWSLHRALFSGQLKNLDFAQQATTE